MKRARICILIALTLIFVLGFGSTALADEGDGETHVEAQMVNPPPSPYDLSYYPEGDCQITAEYSWTIQKNANESIVSIKPGQTDDVIYTISAEKTLVSSSTNETIKGCIGIDPHRGNKVKVVVSACLKEDGQIIASQEDITSDWSAEDRVLEYDPSFTPQSGSSYEIVFTGTCWLWAAGLPSQNINETISITVSEDITNDFIDVTDTISSNLPTGITSNYNGGLFSFNDSGSQEYTVLFENIDQSSGSFTVTNVARIDQTQYEAPPVTVTVKVPKKSKPPEPREERKVVYPDETPAPEAAAAATELPKTGGLIEWEWIALAGGLLTSGGGAMYLVRRRKMKK